MQHASASHEHARALAPGPCCWPVACVGGLVVVVVPPPASNRKCFSAFGLMQACICICLPFGFAKPDEIEMRAPFGARLTVTDSDLLGIGRREEDQRLRGRPAGRGSGLRDRAGVCFRLPLQFAV